MNHLLHTMTRIFLLFAGCIALAFTLSAHLRAQPIDPDPPIIEVSGNTGKQTASHSAPSFNPTARQVHDSCTAAPPTLLIPAQGATTNDLENPSYYWSPVPNITEYIFQIAHDSSFANPLTSENSGAFPDDAQVKHPSFEDLEPNLTYFWRVASVCANGQIGVFSAPSSFQAGPGSSATECTLPPPTLLEPTNGAQVNTLIPTIKWATASNVYEYRYQWSLNEAFTMLVDSGVVFGVRPDKSATLSDQPTDNLELNTTYYWRVASICADIDTLGAYSAPLSFHTGGDETQLPASPTLQFPDDGITTGSIRVIIRFTQVTGASGYRVEFYDSLQSAEQGDWYRSSGTIQPAVTAVFNPKELVFGRVRSRNDYGWGPLSTIRKFTTPTATATSNITPESGGTLQPDPGYLTVTFPPGAVTSTTTVDFRLLASPQQPLPNFSFANRAFTLVATANGAPITQFNQPYTMVLAYDEGDLLAAGITDPTQLNLLFWNGTAWAALLPCTGCAIDTTNRTVTVVLNHFTEFALVGPLPKQALYLPLIRR
ncbi:MAG: hypothetical protein DYG89_04270 [Caldilinea sp. CFX5]|nr:hypothetical protein [Caldilinea sp. CFX5]